MILLTISALMSSSVVGCANGKGWLGADCCADIPAGAIPEPPGTKICNWQQAQTAAASVDRYVLYQADFVGKTTQLAPRALDRLARLNATANLGSEPIMVEPSGDNELDQSRLVAVENTLVSIGISNAPVELAIPPALGLTGPLAEQSIFGAARNARATSGLRGARNGINNARSFGGIIR